MHSVWPMLGYDPLPSGRMLFVVEKANPFAVLRKSLGLTHPEQDTQKCFKMEECTV